MASERRLKRQSAARGDMTSLVVRTACWEDRLSVRRRHAETRANAVYRAQASKNPALLGGVLERSPHRVSCMRQEPSASSAVMGDSIPVLRVYPDPLFQINRFEPGFARPDDLSTLWRVVVSGRPQPKADHRQELRCGQGLARWGFVIWSFGRPLSVTEPLDTPHVQSTVASTGHSHCGGQPAPSEPSDRR